MHDAFRKEIADPCLGHHWRLAADPTHPGGPGKLVLLDARSSLVAHAFPVPHESSFAIHAGERVIVEQDSNVVRARLEAVAIESAATGQSLRARLVVSVDRRLGRNMELTAPGPVISVVAIGAGSARWLAPTLPNRSVEGDQR